MPTVAPARSPDDPGRALISTLANVVWFVVAGMWLALVYVMAGLALCITLVGVPFGVQLFKLAGYALWPFNRVVIEDPRQDAGLSLLGNMLWILLVGWWLALAHLAVAAVLLVTIVGAPLSLAALRMAGLALAPFGKRVVPATAGRGAPVVFVVGRLR